MFRIHCTKIAETDTNTTEMISWTGCISILRRQFWFERNTQCSPILISLKWSGEAIVFNCGGTLSIKDISSRAIGLNTSRVQICARCEKDLKDKKHDSLNLAGKNARSSHLPRATLSDNCSPLGARGGGTPYNGLYGEAPPERGYLFQASGI